MRIKKTSLAAGLLAAVMIVSLTGCGADKTEEASASLAAAAQSTPSPTPEPTPEPTPTVNTVRFSASGDNLIHEGLYNQARRRAQEQGRDGYDFTFAYENLRDFYAGYDVNWLNQETLVNDAFDPSGYPLFSTPTGITDALYDIGFRVFSTSNNHSYDKGAQGIESSMAHWASMPDDVVTAGFYPLTEEAEAQSDGLSYQTVNGITIGYLSYTEYTNGIPTPSDAEHGVVYLDDTDTISAQMAEMRPNCDVLVVSCHWGVEGSHDVTEAQRQKAQWLADQGADLIIGTHPHVTQTAEWLTAADGRPVFVAYSLGNFISAQSSPDNMIGAILSVSFEKTIQPDGSSTTVVKEPQLIPTVTQYENGYADIRVYLFRDYTDELGAAHGNFALSRDYIQQVLETSIDPTFLVLE
ncbi:CapA family protein [uncultured Gemmiger sp.]|uniref:CapA family protein n=1 Tax=uncultured Gemmiger sp. TaxID=1623490 RepID=UPI0025D23338|nr:CapA family protein [uncultured Gemmiger sp.]